MRTLFSKAGFSKILAILLVGIIVAVSIGAVYFAMTQFATPNASPAPSRAITATPTSTSPTVTPSPTPTSPSTLAVTSTPTSSTPTTTQPSITPGSTFGDAIPPSSMPTTTQPSITPGSTFGDAIPPSSMPTTTQPSITPGSTFGDASIGIVLYAGEINASTSGFGYSASTLSSPGPSLTFRVGQRYTVTLVNVGAKSHNWALVNAKSSNATVMGGQIGSAYNPVSPGTSQSLNLGPFPVTDNLYYICQVDDDVSLGMWGLVTIMP